MVAPISVAFLGGSAGAWRIESIDAVAGESLPTVQRVAVCEGPWAAPGGESAWVLRGVTGHLRYVQLREKEALAAVQPPLGREKATRAALIPIRKSEAWWDLAQDERRAIFEERSHHIAEGLRYLPAIARRLYQSRELGEPFDFLTWFEFAPEHEPLFDELVRALRSTEEWKYVEREVDIRLWR
jgi:chlorite dismutase